MFGLLKKEKLSEVKCNDNELVAMADCKQIDIKSVSDPVFANEMMGKTMAYMFEQESIVICAPTNGILSVMYPTGHAFGITTESGIEILVHIGIDTVNSNGNGFKVYHNQGEPVRAGTPLVKVDFKKLSKAYDMSTMLIITNPNNKNIHFVKDVNLNRGDCVAFIGE